MQNNVTELTEKLLRALDTNYNVTDMQTVIDIIVLLDKVAITKEVLEATRLGKHVNELRRNTSNDWLAKRAKELVKKWRNLVLPPLQQHSQEPTNATLNNGQLKQQSIAHAPPPVVRDKLLHLPQDAHVHNQQEDSGGGAVGAIVAGGGNKKRSAKEKTDTNSSGITSKRPRMNGGSELDLSDTSNSSFHDAVLARNDLRLARTSAAAPSIIQINSDSNSSLPEVKTQLAQDPSISHHFPSTNQQHAPSIITIPILTPPLTSPSSTTSIQPQHLTTSPGLPTTISTPTTPATVQPVIQEQQQQQRRRGRRKGSSAHRSLLDEADASFTSKMARGANARVKTTQELVASLQGRGGGGVMVGVPSSVGAGSAGKVVGGIGGGGMKEDLVQKAAKLTERVSIIDQKLNTNANRYKNNGGSTTTSSSTNKHHYHHHNRHNNINNLNNNNNNSLSNMGMSEANDEDIIVVDEDDFSMKQQRSGSSGRHRKRRDSAGTRGEGGDGDNITIKHDVSTGREVGVGTDGQSDAVPAPPRSLDTATALSLLPPIDRQFLNCTSPSPPDCSCRLTDNTNQITTTVITQKRSDFSVGTDDEDDDQPENRQLLEPLPLYEWEADDDCSAADFLRKKYRLCDVDGDTVGLMHERYIPGVNCNTQSTKVIVNSDQSDNVVPDVYRDLRRKLEAYKPYSISETGLGLSDGVKVEVDDKDRTTTAATNDADTATVESERSEQVEYREYHEILDVPSYNGEMLRILPYVIID